MSEPLDLEPIKAKLAFFRMAGHEHAPRGHSIEPSDVEALIAEVKRLRDVIHNAPLVEVIDPRGGTIWMRALPNIALA